jgi:diguanylate cyclase (GGDEF)-like protein
MLALTFLAAIALLYKKNRLKPQYVISFCFVFLTFILLLIILKPFSSAFEIEDRLFLFKIFETVILLSLIIALLLLIRIRKKFDIQVYRYIVWSILFFILSDLLFHMELSENISEWLNIFRHYFNILAYYLIFKAIVDTGIKKPFDLIFRELKAKEEQLKNQAVTDELTGVLNRRAAFDILEKLLNLAKRNEQYVSICFIDIDDLKLVNDSFGHSAGDELLSTFAATIVKTMRNSDFFCRLGGDEFLLILPDCCLEEAECLLVRIKENIKQVNNQGSKAYNIEFSYGLAFYDYHNEINVDRLIEMADNNMYKNKEDRKHEAIQLTINDLFKPISKSAAQTE